METEDEPEDRGLDFSAALPPPADDQEALLIMALDKLARRVAALVAAEGQMPAAELQEIFGLMEAVEDSPRAGAVLGQVFLLLHEFQAARDLLLKLVARHGELTPFLIQQAIVEEQLGRVPEAIECLQRALAAGERSPAVALSAARLLFQERRHAESIATANLAVLGNSGSSTAPFALLAMNFQATGELNRMLECFGRIEELAGESALVALGELYTGNRELYRRTRKLLQK